MKAYIAGEEERTANWREFILNIEQQTRKSQNVYTKLTFKYFFHKVTDLLACVL